MPRVRELPPPPANPEQSPPATVAGERLVTIPGFDGGPSLEARVRAPAGAKRAVVLCHPHPLYGGTMHSAVVLAIAKVLAERGGSDVAHLRFNYRGVGASEGTYGGGLGEIDDARAAIRALRAEAPRAKVSVCGWPSGKGITCPMIFRNTSALTTTESNFLLLRLRSAMLFLPFCRAPPARAYEDLTHQLKRRVHVR